MFDLYIEDASDFEGQRLSNQFVAFTKQSGLLPPCTIHVYKNTDYPAVTEPIERIGAISLHRDERFFYIRYDISKQEAVIARITHDYTMMDVFYKEISGKYLQSKTAVVMYFGYRYLAVSTGNMMIHSAAIVYRGQGILFCGISGAGKSTQAHLWERYMQAHMLNADKPCLICKDDLIYVHGTPWSGKESVYINSYAPVRCIVFVEQSGTNQVERLSDADAFSLLYLNNYIYPLTDELHDQYIAVVEHISCSVPVFRLYCDVSEQAVKSLYEELFDDNYYEAVNNNLSE